MSAADVLVAVFVGNIDLKDAPYPAVLPPLVAESVVTVEFVAGTSRLDEPLAVLSLGVSKLEDATAVDDDK